MNAIILAAGRGSRLKSLTKNNPKSFLKIYGKTLIERQIENLYAVGIKNISLVVGYKKEKFLYLKKKLFLNKNWNNTNMIYSLFKSKKWLFNCDCIICYSDIIYDKKILKQLLNHKSDFVIPYNLNWKQNWKDRYKNPLKDLETFQISNGLINEIGNKPKNYKDIQGQFMGLVKISKKNSRKLFHFYINLKKNVQKKIHFTNFLDLLIKSKKFSIRGFGTKHYWYEIDNQKDYLVAKNNLKKIKL